MHRVPAALLLLSIAALVVAAGCGGGDDQTLTTGSPAASGATPTGTRENFDRPPTQLELPIHVMVTLPLFEDFVREVGGAHVEVESLVPPGANPHTYEPTAQDIERMKGIDFFFVNGGGLDSHLSDIIEANRDDAAYVIPFAPNILSPQGNGLYAEEAGDNPHLWLDPALADAYPAIIADEFDIYDGINKPFYDENYAGLRDETDAFAAEARAQLGTVPEASRALFTYHDSFPHFARKFGLRVSGFAVTTPGEELAPQRLSALADTVLSSGTLALFAEFGYDSSVMETIGVRAGVEVCTLSSDVLPDGVTTYLQMMRANVAEVIRCLAGQ